MPDSDFEFNATFPEVNKIEKAFQPEEEKLYETQMEDLMDPYNLGSMDDILYSKRQKMTAEEKQECKRQHREATINGDWEAAKQLEVKMYGKVL